LTTKNAYDETVQKSDSEAPQFLKVHAGSTEAGVDTVALDSF